MFPDWNKPFNVRVESGTMARIPVKMGVEPGSIFPSESIGFSHNRRKTLLGDPDARPRDVSWASDVLKEVWNSQRLHNQFYGDWTNMKHQSPEDRAWEDAIRWIEARRLPAKPEPVVFDWDWPQR